MLTIFALPRAFQGHNGIIQTNAIQSWTQLRPACEIILFGDDEGTAETAAKFGIRHVAEVERNEYGTPLVNSLFNAAQKLASHDCIGYVNADILLLSDFVNAIGQVQERTSLIIGRRWDLALREPLDFSNPDWEAQLRIRLAEEGSLHGLSGIDFFLFRRGTYYDIPPFAIGRTAWDNWLIYRARSSGLPVIDATEVATIIHQDHDFTHIAAIQANAGQVYRKGIEGIRNRELLGGNYYSFGLLDATYRLTPAGLKPTMTMSLRYLLYRLLRLPEMHPHLIPLVQLIKGLRSLYYSLRFRAAVMKRRLQKHRLTDSS
ncbi:hypothetical protein ACFLVB_04255 [Chloroflexota bacterium]